MMIPVIVKAVDIKARRLTVIHDDAPTDNNCSYCMCSTFEGLFNYEGDAVFECDRAINYRIEKKQTGLDCRSGASHIYRDISTDPEIIPYKLITDNKAISGSHLKVCHGCRAEYDEVENGYPYEYCPACGRLAAGEHYE